ncbi:MAG: hypothetical protein AAFP82_22745, partial [Bacteroidota bacterium]
LLRTYCMERKYEDLHHAVLAVSGNLQTLIKKERNHTIALDDAMIEHSKIKEQLLEITLEAERYADPSYRRSKNLKAAKKKASKGIPMIAYLVGIVLLLGGLYYLGNHFFDKSTAHQAKVNEKKDSLTIIGGDLQSIPMAQGNPSTEVVEEPEEDVDLEIEQFQSFYNRRIHPEGSTYRRGRYEFPVIDFKFHNTGNALAYLKAFYVDVLEYQVDETAILSMDFSINPKNWNMTMENRGWGTAKNCNCKIENEELAQLFDTTLLEFERDIYPVDEFSNEKDVLYSLAADSADFSQFAKPIIELNKNNTKVKCTYLNKGKEEEAEFPFYGVPVYLDTLGFRKDYDSVTSHPLAVFQAANYLLYINSEEKTYRQDILHQVEADELHRFQITIGGQQSCKVKLQFRFVTNDERELKSKPFEVEIWRPKKVDTPPVEGDVLNVLKS